VVYCMQSTVGLITVRCRVTWWWTELTNMRILIPGFGHTSSGSDPAPLFGGDRVSFSSVTLKGRETTVAFSKLEGPRSRHYTKLATPCWYLRAARLGGGGGGSSLSVTLKHTVC
jgi:hypothetical protein